MAFKWSTVKEATESLKNICTLILYVVITMFFIFVVWPEVKSNFEMNNLNWFGVEMTRKQKDALSTIDKQPTNVSQAKDTNQISNKVFNAAKLIDTTINEGTQNWVYIGQIINGKLTNSHFKITEIPKQGDKLVARDAVYKRKDFPSELKSGDWKLGEIRGVVGDNESVSVIEVKEIADSNFWAKVE